MGLWLLCSFSFFRLYWRNLSAGRLADRGVRAKAKVEEAGVDGEVVVVVVEEEDGEVAVILPLHTAVLTPINLLDVSRAGDRGSGLER